MTLSKASDTKAMLKNILPLALAVSPMTMSVKASSSKLIPYSCSQSWPSFDYFESILFGRSCAVLPKNYAPWPLWISPCSSGDQVCTSQYSLCGKTYSEDILQYLATGIITGVTKIYAHHWAGRGYPTESSSLMTVPSYNTPWRYTGKPPCCGPCSLDGGTVQVYVWPGTETSNRSITATAASSKNQSLERILVSNGFTFTSPSIYVAFQSLLASNYCGPVGSSYVMTTLAFEPNQLMTGAQLTVISGGSLRSDYIWSTMEPQNFQGNCGIKTVTGVLGNSWYQNATDSSVFYTNHTETVTYTMRKDNPFIYVVVQSMTYDPCKPLLSVPSEVFKLDTAWLNCTAGISGLWDPPRVLQPASGPLTPDPTTTSQADPHLISSAVPASIVAPNTPTATTSAGPSPKPLQVFPASSSSSDDPGSSPEPGINRDPASKPQPGPSQNPSPPSDPRASVDPGASVANSEGSGGSIQEGVELHSQYGSSSGPTRANLDPPAPAPTITIGSHTAIVLPNEGVSVNGATMNAGVAPITLDNTPISVGSSYVMIGTSSLALPNVSPDLPSVAPNGHVVIAGTTLLQGGPGATIAGTAVSLGANGLIIGSSTFAISSSVPALTPTLPLIGGQAVHVASNGDVVIAGTTITPGKAGALISGTPVSLGSNGLVVGSSTYAVPAPSSAPTLPSIGGQQVQQAANGGVVVAGTTLLPGTPGMMISGTSVTLDSAGLIVGSSTYALQTSTSAGVYTIGGETITAGPSSEVLLGGQTLSLGGAAATVSGTIISLDSVGLVVGHNTYSIPAASHEAAPLLTFGGRVYTANTLGDFVVGSQTLLPGGAGITISGTPVSLAPSDGDVVAAGETSSIGLGGLIMGGFGGKIATTTSSALANSSVVAFTGQAGRGSDVLDRYGFFLSAIVVLGFGTLAFGL